MKRRTSTPSKITPSKRSKDVFLVEKVVGVRNLAQGAEYLVSWEGYPRASDNTWEPVENILDAKLISDFEASWKSSRAVEQSLSPKKRVASKSKTVTSSKNPKVSENSPAQKSIFRKETMKRRTPPKVGRIATPAAAPSASFITPIAPLLVAPAAEIRRQSFVSPLILLVLVSAAMGAVLMLC